MATLNANGLHMNNLQLGVRHNQNQVLQQLLQVLLVGMTVGMMRNVVPALAEQHGRKKVLLWGWLLAWPIPLMIYVSSSWIWIVGATLLLGANQGMTWSMTQTSVLDFTNPKQRGLVIGLNEFAGYVGVALAAIATGYAANWTGPRAGLLWFGSLVIGVATLSALIVVVESSPWLALHPNHGTYGTSPPLSTWHIFQWMTWQNKRMMALSQAGLVEKFVDALVWIIWPIYLKQQGLTLPSIGWVVGSYGIAWGVAQLLTGPWSDRVGRHRLNVAGMWLCGLGVALFPVWQNVTWWTGTAVLTGLGMAMLYPNLSAAVVDRAGPAWRASAIGIYRFWRDIGYALGAAGIGMVAFITDKIESTFGFVALCMFLSGALMAWQGRKA